MYSSETLTTTILTLLLTAVTAIDYYS